MTKPPKYVQSYRDRHGKLRNYFRRPQQKSIPLPGEIGSPEFEAKYAEALAGKAAQATKKKGKPVEGTIGALIVYYKQSADFNDLRESSKTGYLSRLKIFEDNHGHRTLSGLNIDRIEEKILKPYLDRPGQRLALLKMLRKLINFGIRKGKLKHDPSKGIKRPKGGHIRSWTEREIAQFETCWPIGTKQRLAFALMIYTGQRRSDVHRMTWRDVTGTTIDVIQQKTGTPLTIPLHRDLQTILKNAPRNHVTILNTAFGKPFTVSGFGNYLRDAITKAGLGLDTKPHGLRKAQGRRLAEAGCSAKEIMAILGHKTMSEAQLYVEEASQTHLARAAILKLERGSGENK